MRTKTLHVSFFFTECLRAHKIAHRTKVTINNELYQMSSMWTNTDTTKHFQRSKHSSTNFFLTFSIYWLVMHDFFFTVLLLSFLSYSVSVSIQINRYWFLSLFFCDCNSRCCCRHRISHWILIKFKFIASIF